MVISGTSICIGITVGPVFSSLTYICTFVVPVGAIPLTFKVGAQGPADLGLYFNQRVPGLASAIIVIVSLSTTGPQTLVVVHSLMV